MSVTKTTSTIYELIKDHITLEQPYNKIQEKYKRHPLIWTALYKYSGELFCFAEYCCSHRSVVWKVRAKSADWGKFLLKSDKLHRIPGGFSLITWLLRDVDATQVSSLSVETLIIFDMNQNASPPLMGLCWLFIKY